MTYLEFYCNCSFTKPGDTVHVVGDLSALGEWNVHNAIPLQTNAEIFPLWKSDLIAIPNESSFEFKFFYYSFQCVKWENIGGNRKVSAPTYPVVEIHTEFGCEAPPKFVGSNSIMDFQSLQSNLGTDSVGALSVDEQPMHEKLNLNETIDLTKSEITLPFVDLQRISSELQLLTREVSTLRRAQSNIQRELSAMQLSLSRSNNQKLTTSSSRSNLEVAAARNNDVNFNNTTASVDIKSFLNPENPALLYLTSLVSLLVLKFSEQEKGSANVGIELRNEYFLRERSQPVESTSKKEQYNLDVLNEKIQKLECCVNSLLTKRYGHEIQANLTFSNYSPKYSNMGAPILMECPNLASEDKVNNKGCRNTQLQNYLSSKVIKNKLESLKSKATNNGESDLQSMVEMHDRIINELFKRINGDSNQVEASLAEKKNINRDSITDKKEKKCLNQDCKDAKNIIKKTASEGDFTCKKPQEKCIRGITFQKNIIDRTENGKNELANAGVFLTKTNEINFGSQMEKNVKGTSEVHKFQDIKPETSVLTKCHAQLKIENNKSIDGIVDQKLADEKSVDYATGKIVNENKKDEVSGIKESNIDVAIIQDEQEIKGTCHDEKIKNTEENDVIVLKDDLNDKTAMEVVIDNSVDEILEGLKAEATAIKEDDVISELKTEAMIVMEAVEEIDKLDSNRKTALTIEDDIKPTAAKEKNYMSSSVDNSKTKINKSEICVSNEIICKSEIVIEKPSNIYLRDADKIINLESDSSKTLLNESKHIKSTGEMETFYVENKENNEKGKENLAELGYPNNSFDAECLMCDVSSIENQHVDENEFADRFCKEMKEWNDYMHEKVSLQSDLATLSKTSAVQVGIHLQEAHNSVESTFRNGVKDQESMKLNVKNNVTNSRDARKDIASNAGQESWTKFPLQNGNAVICAEQTQEILCNPTPYDISSDKPKASSSKKKRKYSKRGNLNQLLLKTKVTDLA